MGEPFCHINAWLMNGKINENLARFRLRNLSVIFAIRQVNILKSDIRLTANE